MSDARPGGPGGGFSELRLRVLSALILVPIVVAATWYGGLAFTLLAAIGAAIIYTEWIGLTGRCKSSWADWVFATIAVFSVLAAYFFTPRLALLLLVAGVLLTLGRLLADRHFVWPAAGIVYAGLGGVALVALRLADHGLVAVGFVFAVVWGTDIAAYFAGRAIGGPKLWPKVSPKKTWSGAIGGLCFAVGAGCAVVAGAGLPLTFWTVAVAALLSAVSQLGDFFESWIKRRAGKKDSGTLIPGHGGVMDRVDGLVFAAAAAALIGWLRGGFAEPARGLLVW